MNGRRSVVVVFLFFLALAVIFTAPLSLAPAERAANDGDPLHISWILAWDAHQMVRAPFHLFDSNTFYPYASSLAFSEHLLGVAVFAAPVYYVTGNALLAQNLSLLFTLALSATGMYLFVKELSGRTDAAIVAGMVFAFHTYNFFEIPRLQLLSTGWFPLALLFLHRAMTGGRRRDVLLFSLFFTLQGLANIYYLFYFALMLAYWLPAYAIAVDGGWRRLTKFVLPLGAAGIVFVLVALPYLRMVRDFGFVRSLAEGLDVLEYLRPPAGSVYANIISFDFAPTVAHQFLGLTALALALLGIATYRSQVEASARILFGLSVATLAVGVVLSLGPMIRVGGEELSAGPYRFLYEHVPLFRVLRSPKRMSVLVHFGLAVAAGIGASTLFSRVSTRAVPWLRVLLVVILPYEHFAGGQPFTTLPTGSHTPEVYRWLGQTPPDEPVVELPLYPRSQLRRHALYMFYSTYHWRPIVFGRTSFYPPLAGYLAWELRDFPDAVSIELLERLGVERIVVHPNAWPAEERASRLARLRAFADRLEPEGAFASLEGRPYDTYGFGDERVYRLRGGGIDVEAALCDPAGEIAPSGWALSGDAETPHEWAIDRDPETRWRTDRQLPGMKLQIDLGRVETVSAVRLTVAYPHDEFPRDLTVKARASRDERFERVLFRDDVETKWELAGALVNDAANAAMTLRFEPRRARYLRFWVREGKAFDYTLPSWSLPELHIYRQCNPHPQ